MAEVDYQMALLMQYKFDQELKRKENTDSDHQLALELQEHFRAEKEVERPKNNLVYKAPNLNTSKCLVDPSWEVIDPTPDVHVLFMAFNQKFFWGTLGSVTVSWSKRMTTCAGVCSYQGRGGMCSITLSEPLLKLRPRKDLVETLLHEMIHAYLFVTHSNRDRDGHGPEFHKHMYRINAEAGTNITVYHDFHDEVRLYQQHWWRCDGPCQNRKPFFGMVRRATNRTPGPHDRWWDDHMRSCGGNFIKVKSPEAKETTKKTKKPPPKVTNPKNDIRSYIPSSSKTPVTAGTATSTPKSKSSLNHPTQLPNNIHTVSNPTQNAPQVSNVIPSKTSNIFGFTNLGSTSNTSQKPNKGSGVKGAVKNAGSSTFVVTKKGSKTSDKDSKPPQSSTTELQPFSGTGRSLSDGASLNNRDYSTVRDHWLKKFENTGSQRAGVKRPSNVLVSPKQSKLPKIVDDDVECPVCSKKMTPELLNDHLDVCLESSEDICKKECIICGEHIARKEFDSHVRVCSAKNFSNDDFEDDESDSKPACSSKSDPTIKTVDLTDITDDEDESKNCPVCKKKLAPHDYDIHVQDCILSMCDEFDNKYETVQSPKTKCLACGTDILKTDLESHLEDCMSMSHVFDLSKVDVEEEDATLEIKYNCPLCMKLVTESEMQGHLDGCLDSESSESNVKSTQRNLLMESFCSISDSE